MLGNNKDDDPIPITAAYALIQPHKSGKIVIKYMGKEGDKVVPHYKYLSPSEMQQWPITMVKQKFGVSAAKKLSQKYVQEAKQKNKDNSLLGRFKRLIRPSAKSNKKKGTKITNYNQL